MEDYMGSIRIFVGTFAPNNFMFCDGKLLSIAEYDALFSIIGTTYGGDGVRTFALPDYRGRVPIGIGQGPGLTMRVQGERAGVENVTLLSQQMPTHNHNCFGLSRAPETNNPANAFLPTYPNPSTRFYSTQDPGDQLLPMNQRVVDLAGGSQPHPNMPPYLAVNYIICVYGIYPTRAN